VSLNLLNRSPVENKMIDRQLEHRQVSLRPSFLSFFCDQEINEKLIMYKRNSRASPYQRESSNAKTVTSISLFVRDLNVKRPFYPVTKRISPAHFRSSSSSLASSSSICFSQSLSLAVMSFVAVAILLSWPLPLLLLPVTTS